ncbi:MAG: secretin N-terminal domain-containing protein [Vulcanimicrobiota bacterium]
MSRKRGWKIARLGVLTIAMVLLVSYACYASTVTGMTVKKSDEIVEIHVNANGPVHYRVTSSCEPKQSIVVEMSSVAILESAEKIVQIDKGIIERAKLMRTSAGKARLVVDVLHPVKYSIEAAEGGRGFVLTMSTQTVAAKVSKAVPKVTTEEKVVEKTPEPVEEPTTIQEKDTCEPFDHVNIKAQKRKAAAKKKAKTKPVKLVSIDFVNADLIYVLKLLAKELELNLVTDSSVTGSVTMSLKDVSAQTALNIIVQLNGFKQKKLGNILFVGSEDTVNAITPDVIAYQPSGDVQIETIRLEYLSAGDAIDTIKASFPLVEAHSSPQGNAIIVQANPEMMEEIRGMITGIDIPAPEAPAMPSETVEIYRVKYGDANALIPTIQTLLGADAPATMEVEPRLNAIIFKGYESQIERAKTALEDLDIPLEQVMISIKVVDLSETGAKNLGVSWQIGTGDGTQPITWSEIPDDYANNASPTGYQAYNGEPFDPWSTGPPDYAGSPIGFFVRNPFVLTSALSLQITQGEAKVLATPRVAAISGQSAQIHIGDKYPIVYYDPRAGQYQVIYIDIGIQLTVKPTITSDGYITTDVATTVSDLRELINNQYPRTTERSASLTIRVKDSNTIVIGGMVNESTRKAVSKLPLLGDIPILGKLFSNTSIDRSKGEVVIMITPKIINQ